MNFDSIIYLIASIAYLTWIVIERPNYYHSKRYLLNECYTEEDMVISLKILVNVMKHFDSLDMLEVVK